MGETCITPAFSNTRGIWRLVQISCDSSVRLRTLPACNADSLALSSEHRKTNSLRGQRWHGAAQICAFARSHGKCVRICANSCCMAFVASVFLVARRKSGDVASAYTNKSVLILRRIRRLQACCNACAGRVYRVGWKGGPRIEVMHLGRIRTTALCLARPGPGRQSSDLWPAGSPYWSPQRGALGGAADGQAAARIAAALVSGDQCIRAFEYPARREWLESPAAIVAARGGVGRRRAGFAGEVSVGSVQAISGTEKNYHEGHNGREGMIQSILVSPPGRVRPSPVGVLTDARCDALRSSHLTIRAEQYKDSPRRAQRTRRHTG